MLSRREDQIVLEKIFRAGLAAVAGREAVQRWLEKEAGKWARAGRKLWIVGAGKATAAMAQGAEEFFSTHYSLNLAGGLIVVKEGHGLPLNHIECLEASHPVPDVRSEQAGRRILELVQGVSSEDLILCLLSGGASALMAVPAGKLTLADKIGLTEKLLACGATIHEMNALRKHCSAIKGGRLALAAGSDLMCTLALSDVPGDRPETIASGPTVGDPSTLEDCFAILRKFDLEEELSPALAEHLGDPEQETPKPVLSRFQRDSYRLIARNGDALSAARHEAGRNALHIPDEQPFFSEDITVVAQAWQEWKEKADQMLAKPYCLIAGGEPTVRVKGGGKGGRNTELALRLAGTLSGRFAFLSAGTDGTDGPTDAAGAFADETTVTRAQDRGLLLDQYLRENDSYHFFQALGELFFTGPTGTNVMDLQMLIVRE